METLSFLWGSPTLGNRVIEIFFFDCFFSEKKKWETDYSLQLMDPYFQQLTSNILRLDLHLWSSGCVEQSRPLGGQGSPRLTSPESREPLWWAHSFHQEVDWNALLFPHGFILQLCFQQVSLPITCPLPYPAPKSTWPSQTLRFWLVFL